MSESRPRQCIAFNGMQHIATGTFAEVAIKIKRVVDRGQHRSILLFDARTSELLDVDTRGSVEDVALRYAGAFGEGSISDGAAPTEVAADVSRAWTPQTRRGGARIHLASSPLGLAQQPDWRRLGGIAQAG